MDAAANNLPDLDTLDLAALIANASAPRHTADERDAITAEHNALCRKLHALHVCPKCAGRGKIAEYAHIAGGDCFACSGTGRHVMNTRVGKIAAGLEAQLAALRDELAA